MRQKTETVLAGRVIWVTRPRQQAEALCNLITAAGGKAIRLPVIAIQPVFPERDNAALAADLTASDLVIFISRNAVEHATTVLPSIYTIIRGRIILAVGAGTRAALEQRGCRQVISTDSGMGSEALLQLPQLQPAAVADKHILIIRGVGGRELLEHQLRGAGAKVHYLEVYRRCVPDGGIADLWHTDPPDVIIITSIEGLHNLVKMTTAERRAELLQTPLAVLSERIATVARTLGFIPVPAVAPTASDAGLLQATMGIFEA